MSHQALLRRRRWETCVWRTFVFAVVFAGLNAKRFLENARYAVDRRIILAFSRCWQSQTQMKCVKDNWSMMQWSDPPIHHVNAFTQHFMRKTQFCGEQHCKWLKSSSVVWQIQNRNGWKPYLTCGLKQQPVRPQRGLFQQHNSKAHLASQRVTLIKYFGCIMKPTN